MKPEKIIKLLILIFLSYLTGISLAHISHYSVTMIDAVVPCLMGLAAVVYLYVEKLDYRKELKYILPFGAVLSLTLVMGSKIHVYEETIENYGIMDAVAAAVLTFFFGSVAVFLLHWMDTINNKRDLQNSVEENPHSFWIFAGIYAVCYLPYFLTFYPGNCGADTFESVRIALGEIPWTNHQPVLFTALIKIILDLTSGFLSLRASLAVFSFLHMLAFAAILGCLTCRILRYRVAKEIKGLSVLFFALHPIMAMYSIYLTKDVLFGGILVLLILKLYDVVESQGELLGKWQQCLQLSTLFLLSAMLRNNGFYILLCMSVVLLVRYRKYWKQLLLVVGSVFVIYQIYQGPVFRALGIEKQSFAEAASVPLQQIGYVIWQGGEISEEDAVFLNELMPLAKVKEVYEPGYTDPYKFDEEFNDEFLNENVGEFLRVWWNLCRNNFSEYVESYLMQTAGYWHYGETNSVCTQGVTENTLGVARYDVFGNVLGISLEPIIEKLVLTARKAPILCALSSMAMQMFMVWLVMIQYCRKKKTERILPLLPLVILWGTIMIATPAFCLLRYLFPVFILWPLLAVEFVSD